jgi:hypothetical protein
MTIATQYAKALYELGDRANIKNLRAALSRRGHVKLMPLIFAEYQKLLQGDARLKMHNTTTPEKERTHTLLQLYKKLTV